MSDIQNGILGVLEARGGLVHRLDIMGDLPTFQQATVDAYLSEMVKSGLIRRPKKGYYATLDAEDPASTRPWEDESAAPFARIRSFLEDQGPQTKARMSQQLTGIAHYAQVMREMAADGTIHIGTDGLVRLGPHPARKAKLNGQQRWSEGRDPVPIPAPDVGADPNTRSEEEQRQAGAPAVSAEPEAVATPSPAGDAPDASADVESPPPAMGPAVASSEETMPEPKEATLQKVIHEREAELRIDVDDFRCEISGNGPAAWSAIAAVISALQAKAELEQ